MIQKDTGLLGKVLDDSFVFTHMTGAKQTKKEYIDAISSGAAKYFSAQTDKTEATVLGNNADVLGQTRVSAQVEDVKGDFRLQLDLKPSKSDGEF